METLGAGDGGTGDGDKGDRGEVEAVVRPISVSFSWKTEVGWADEDAEQGPQDPQDPQGSYGQRSPRGAGSHVLWAKRARAVGVLETHIASQVGGRVAVA